MSIATQVLCVILTHQSLGISSFPPWLHKATLFILFFTLGMLMILNLDPQNTVMMLLGDSTDTYYLQRN